MCVNLVLTVLIRPRIERPTLLHSGCKPPVCVRLTKCVDETYRLYLELFEPEINHDCKYNDCCLFTTYNETV